MNPGKGIISDFLAPFVRRRGASGGNFFINAGPGV